MEDYVFRMAVAANAGPDFVGGTVHTGIVGEQIKGALDSVA